MIKSTYGTGCFALLNIRPPENYVPKPASDNGRLPPRRPDELRARRFNLHGRLGRTMDARWPRRNRPGEPKRRHSQNKPMLARMSIFVPAFTGLGAPYWDADCRGCDIWTYARPAGQQKSPGRHLRASPSRHAIFWKRCWPICPEQREQLIRVDGGMSANDWVMQFLADQLGLSVDRPGMTETTALGAAYLAGLQAGLYPAPAEFADQWKLERRFEPRCDAAVRTAHGYCLSRMERRCAANAEQS